MYLHVFVLGAIHRDIWQNVGCICPLFPCPPLYEFGDPLSPLRYPAYLKTYGILDLPWLLFH